MRAQPHSHEVKMVMIFIMRDFRLLLSSLLMFTAVSCFHVISRNYFLRFIRRRHIHAAVSHCLCCRPCARYDIRDSATEQRIVEETAGRRGQQMRAQRAGSNAAAGRYYRNENTSVRLVNKNGYPSSRNTPYDLHPLTPLKNLFHTKFAVRAQWRVPL